MSKNKLTRNWIAVGIIWIGVLVLTYLNSQTIQQIKSNQANIESMRMDSVFLKNNFEKITRVLTQRASLHKTIDSLPIELLSLDNMLKSRANKQGLSKFRMEPDPTTRRADQVSLKIQVTGTYRQMALWLRALENEVPYLIVTRVRMLEDSDTKGYAFRLNMDFRYNLALQDEPAT